MLLNEFLKEHCKVEEQSHEIATQRARIVEFQNDLAQQRKDFAQQQSEIKALTVSLQKVSDQFQLNKRESRIVTNQ